MHVRPKGKRVNYRLPADDESNCITLSDLEVEAEEWEPGYEDLVGISVEPKEEDGFVTDMEEHGPNWDEDIVHFEVEDELCRREMVATEEAIVWARPRRAPSMPVFVTITQADWAAGVWKRHDS